jgi:hypothetical protein
LIRLSSNAIYGKKTLGTLVPIVSKDVEFYPIAGIYYVFSTVGESYMNFQGAVPQDAL